MRVVAKAWANRGRGVLIAVFDDGTRSDGRRGWNLSTASRVDNGCGIDSRHPDAHLVLLEQVGDELVEVDIRLSVVEVSQLVIITGCVSMRLMRTWK